MTLKTTVKETSLALEYFCLQPFVFVFVFVFFFLTFYWGKNAIMAEFTRRRIIKEIKVINYSYKNN